MTTVLLSDQGSIIKTAYEGESDTNAFTDTLKTKLDSVESGATADQTDAQIVAAVTSEVGNDDWKNGAYGGLLFEASDITGATDMTSELKAKIEAAAGNYVFIPKGIYLINDLHCDSDVRVICAKGAVFLNDYGYRAIQQRNEDEADASQACTVEGNIDFATSQRVTRLTVSDATAYSKADVVHIHSQDNYLLSGDDRRVGQASKVGFVDTVNNYVYLNEDLELADLILTSPRVRKYGSRVFDWEGGEFKANGTYDDVSLGDATKRRACVEVWGTVGVKFSGATFKNTWMEGLELKGCPYSHVTNIVGTEMLNLLTEDETPRNITGITIADPCVVTLDNVVGLSAGNDIVISGIVGTTELNNRPFRVSAVSGSTITLDNHYAAPSGDLSSVGMTAYVSGGEVAKGDINALGYTVRLYASCCHTVIDNVRTTEGRHAVTADGIGDASYSDTQYAEYGFPCNVLVQNCTSHNPYGIPFDEHEEAVNWTWSNCHVFNAQRGSEGGSYMGEGFQMRGLNSKIIGCTVNGGSAGFRIVPQDLPVKSKYVVKSCLGTNLRGRDDGTGYGLRINPVNSNPTNRAKVYIDGYTTIDSGTGIHKDAGADIIIGASGVTLSGCDEMMDVNEGYVKALGKVSMDFSDSPWTTNYGVRMRGAIDVLLFDGATVIKGENTKPAGLFYGADSTAKTYYMPVGKFVQDKNGYTDTMELLDGDTSGMTVYDDMIVPLILDVKALTDNYTLTDEDSCKTLYMSAGAEKTITVPSTLSAGFKCAIIQEDAYTITFAASGGNTLYNKDSYDESESQHAVCYIHVISSGTGGKCYLSGDTGWSF